MSATAITDQATIEPVTMTDLLELASWERLRSDDELRNFVARRESIVANLSE